jgi:hypothetical protein
VGNQAWLPLRGNAGAIVVMSTLKEAINALKSPNLEVDSARRRPVVRIVFKKF